MTSAPRRRDVDLRSKVGEECELVIGVYGADRHAVRVARRENHRWCGTEPRVGQGQTITVCTGHIHHMVGVLTVIIPIQFLIILIHLLLELRIVCINR